jgi:hypothetical protein
LVSVKDFESACLTLYLDREMVTKTHCPGCYGADFGPPLIWKSQPVVLNYRFNSAEEAQSVPRRDMEIRQCMNCGLIFNTTLDESIIPYDDRYENRQSYSPSFSALMTDTAMRLTDRFILRQGLVMEVGCGKGEFLKLICNYAGARGLGYDTSCDEDTTCQQSQVRFFKRYATSGDVIGKVDAVICRHVVEHVSMIGSFMRLIADISTKGDSRVVYVETPAWEWIVENVAFWDVFYEHCNYFSMPTLRHLAMLAGMEVLDHRRIFGGQYQALELRRAWNLHTPLAPGVTKGAALSDFAGCITAARKRLKAQLIAAGAAKGWAIWGAGAKGASLSTAFPELPPRLVVDSNPAKQGSYIPGSNIPVIAPDDFRIGSVSVIVIANPNYSIEISATMALHGHKPQLLII